MAIGLTVSCTLTVAAQVAVLAFTSVTVSTTALLPTFEHVKLLLSNVKDAMPQASLDPLLICVAVIVDVPPLFRYVVMF